MKRDSGGVLIEAAIILGVLFFLLGGMVDLALLYRESDVVIEAARHGARSGAGTGQCVSSTPDDPNDRITNFVKRETTDHLVHAGLTVSDWEVKVSRSDPIIGDENPSSPLELIPIYLINVSVAQPQNSRSHCILCLAPFLWNLKVNGSSTFALETAEICP